MYSLTSLFPFSYSIPRLPEVGELPFVEQSVVVVSLVAVYSGPAFAAAAVSSDLAQVCIALRADRPRHSCQRLGFGKYRISTVGR